MGKRSNDISTRTRRLKKGRRFYEYAEFWQLDETGAYRVVFAGSEGVYRSRELHGFWLRVEWLWKQPPLSEVLKEWGLR
jgi:hypothetical protein